MLIPEDYAQVNFRFGGVAVPTGAECTLGLAVAGTSGDPSDIATAAIAAWTSAQMNVNQSSLITLTSVLCKVGPNSTGGFAEVTASVNGTQPEATPPNTAFLLRKNTAFGGRTGRGRMFIPGVPEGQVDSSGTIAGVFMTAVNGRVDDFFDDLTAASLLPVVLHAEGSPPTPPRVISGFDVSNKVATQRRRLRR